MVRDAGAAAREPKNLASVPTAVRDVLRHRLRGHPEPTREALAAAAVLGREVEIVQLARLLDRTEDQVIDSLDAVAAGVLVEAGGSWAGAYAFPHELMRDAVYSEIPAPRRHRLHRRVADVMLADRSSDADVITAAVHVCHAGSAVDPRAGAELVMRAARIARSGFAWDEAIRLGESGLGFMRKFAAPRERADAELWVAMLRLNASREFPRAVELLESALERYLKLGDFAAAGTVHGRLGIALCIHPSILDVARSLEHFAAAERMLPDPEEVFHLYRGRMYAAMRGLDIETLGEAAQRASALAARLSRQDLSAAACWGTAWYAINRGEADRALGSLEEAWRAARVRADAYLAWPPVNAAGLICTVLLLDPAAGRAWCRKGLAQPRFDSFAFAHDTVVDQLALALAETGELDAARRAAQGLPEGAVAQRMLQFLGGDWESAAGDWSAALSRDLGDWESAAGDWSAALSRDLAAGDRHDAALNARWLAMARLTLGEEAAARKVLQEALEIAVAGPQLPTELWVRAHLAALNAAAAPAEAQTHLARCDDVMRAGENWRGLRGEVVLAHAVVAAARADWPQAERCFKEAAEVFVEHRLPWRLAETLRAWGDVLTETGHAEAGHGQRQQAVAVYQELGAPDRWRHRVLREAP